MSNYEEVLARLSDCAAAAERAIEENIQQEQEAKARISQLADERRWRYNAKERVSSQRRTVNHLAAGKCFHRITSGYSDTRCDKPAKVTCPKCEAPLCGTHNRVSKYGDRAHSCGSWTSFKTEVIDGQGEAAPPQM